MSQPKQCPYCKAKYSCSGCITRHVRKWHPKKIKDYIDNYLGKI